MATPPAPTAASVEAARIRAAQGQFDNSLDAVVRLVVEGNKIKAARRESLQRGVTKLDEFIGKGQNDAFVKLADLNTTYGRALQQGSVQPIDKIKYLVQIMELQKDVNVSLNKGNEQRLATIIRQAETETGGRIKDPATNRRIFELYFDDASASAYNPTLTGDIDYLTKATDVENPLSFDIPGDTGVMQQYNDRLAAQQSLNNAAQVIVNSFGPNALKDLSSAAGSGQVSTDVQTKLNGIPNAEFDRLRTVAEKIPGLTDLTTRRKAYDKEIAKLNTEMSGDLVMQAQTALKSFGVGETATKDSRISAMARLVGRPKFQDWAASNGLKVGNTRPADRPGDKDLPGYDSATNTVYVPGPDDERAVRVAMRQSTLRPERQILPRRGLEARRVLSVQVGEPSPDAAKVNKDGKYRTLDGRYATDAEIEAARDKKTTAEVSAATGGKVFKMKDGSFAFISDAPDSELEPISADDTRVKTAQFSPAVVAPDNDTLGVTEAERPTPSATRTITGRETALLPSDPEGATVLETADGRRIVIPKEQAVDVSEVTKAAPLEGETTSRGIRMPFAALRARRAGVGKTPTEAEVEALPEAGGVRAPAPVSAEVAGAPTIGSRVAPAAPTPMPAPAPVAVKPEAAPTPTPGQEVGKDVRDAMGAPTGATAPRPVGVADGGSKASVPAMPMSALDRIRAMRMEAPPASPAQAPKTSTMVQPSVSAVKPDVLNRMSAATAAPIDEEISGAPTIGSRIDSKSGLTNQDRIDAARRRRLADIKREQDAYYEQFMADERAAAAAKPASAP
jgi:hypothetical protein